MLSAGTREGRVPARLFDTQLFTRDDGCARQTNRHKNINQAPAACARRKRAATGAPHMEEFIAFLEVKSLPFHLHSRS